MLLHNVRLFFRRCRRLIEVVIIILSETAYLKLTLPGQPIGQRLMYRAKRQSVACRRVLRTWNVEVRTTGHSPPPGASVIASNHLGIIDAFAISAVLPVAISGKAELLRVPLVGWVCRSIAMIPVYRTRRLLSAEFASNVSERLDAGVNVLVFPEGTTVRGTDVLPFKTGGFAAIEFDARRKALPMALIPRQMDGLQVDSDTQSWFTWADPRQTLFGHLWRLLGIQSARIDIVLGSALPAANRSRKDLADHCFETVSIICKSQVLPADTSS